MHFLLCFCHDFLPGYTVNQRYDPVDNPNDNICVGEIKIYY